MDYTSECLSLISFCGHFENRAKVINLICNKLEIKLNSLKHLISFKNTIHIIF